MSFYEELVLVNALEPWTYTNALASASAASVGPQTQALCATPHVIEHAYAIPPKPQTQAIHIIVALSTVRSNSPADLGLGAEMHNRFARNTNMILAGADEDVVTKRTL
jgi:hypothetical protein